MPCFLMPSMLLFAISFSDGLSTSPTDVYWVARNSKMIRKIVGS